MVENTGQNLGSERLGKIRQAVLAARAELPGDVVSVVAGRYGETPDCIRALSLYDPDVYLSTALVRKAVSEKMWGEDANLSPDEQRAIVDRQIDSHFEQQIGDSSIHGFVEADHGTKTSAELTAKCDALGTVDYDVGVNEIARMVLNHVIYKPVRLVADPNCLEVSTDTSMRSENLPITARDNMNAVKAQRDLTARILESQGNLENGRAKNPYLVVYVHGKTDKRGHDFEIGCKNRAGKIPLDPRIAFWFADQLRDRLLSRDILNAKGVPPTVNVVADVPPYASSPALGRMRWGDGLFDFKGFGEQFNALQLECGRFLRDTHSVVISEILEEILREFSATFIDPSSVESLNDQYGNMFDEKVAEERSRIFSRSNVLFKQEYPSDEIDLSIAMRELLEVDRGDTIFLNGHALRVCRMKKADVRIGKTMLLHSSFESEVGDFIDLRKNL